MANKKAFMHKDIIVRIKFDRATGMKIRIPEGEDYKTA